MEKVYKIYYGEGKDDYIRRTLQDNDIINGYLSEAKAFELFYNSMIICNNYFKNIEHFDDIDEIISSYNEEDDYYTEEYQIFIIDPEFDSEITKKATEKMGNTLYFDNKMDLYLTGITDLGASRTIVSTDLKVESEEQ